MLIGSIEIRKQMRPEFEIFLISYDPSNAYAAMDYSYLSTMVTKTINGKQVIQWVKCPAWDWSIVEAACLADGMELNQYIIAFNCLPKCGKWKGDRPDIGAFEWIEGITNEKPWGIWTGVPIDQLNPPMKPAPTLEEVKKFGIK